MRVFTLLDTRVADSGRKGRRFTKSEQPRQGRREELIASNSRISTDRMGEVASANAASRLLATVTCIALDPLAAHRRPSRLPWTRAEISEKKSESAKGRVVHRRWKRKEDFPLSFPLFLQGVRMAAKKKAAKKAAKKTVKKAAKKK